MNINEARAIGAAKLNIDRGLFDKCGNAAKEMGVEAKHMAPMILALAILGIADAVKGGQFQGELTDALALVSKAENEWRMEQRMGNKGRIN